LKAALRGFVIPHRGINPWCPPVAQSSQLHTTFRPRRSSRPRRLAPPRALRVCFTPQPRPGFSLQGFDPIAKPYRVLPGLCPPAVSATAPTIRRLRQLDRPRLQGLALHDDCDGLRWTVRSIRTSRPSWGFSPPGTRTEPLERLHAPSAHGLVHEEPFMVDPRRVASSVVIVLEPDRSTRSRFLA
jgi:hypothetical protein